LRGREETKPNDSDSESRSEKAGSDRESDCRFDSDILNQPRPMPTRRVDADQKGRCRPEGSMPTRRVVDAEQKGGRCHTESKQRSMYKVVRGATLQTCRQRKASEN
jgi:hypothetical protein